MTEISVAVIGNHRFPFCSEAVWARAFAKVGCAVTAFQVDDVARDPNAAIERLKHYTLITYTRTHSRGMFLDRSWTDRWRELENGGTRVIGLHLDLYVGLDRQALIEEGDSQFTVGRLYTADGGHDDYWRARGIDHRWFQPGIDEDDCITGTARPEYAHDLVFVGSGAQTYHAAYQGRSELLDHLRRTYGGRFCHYGHGGDRPAVRGPALADIYASSRVVIGDSCFAHERGSPRSFKYASDRCPESLGRRAFLIHPYVPGMIGNGPYLSGVHLATCIPGDWDDLDAQIGTYLAAPGYRDGIAQTGYEYVKANHTYTHRMREVLASLGLVEEPVTVAPSE